MFEEVIGLARVMIRKRMEPYQRCTGIVFSFSLSLALALFRRFELFSALSELIVTVASKRALPPSRRAFQNEPHHNFSALEKKTPTRGPLLPTVIWIREVKRECEKKGEKGKLCTKRTACLPPFGIVTRAAGTRPSDAGRTAPRGPAAISPHRRRRVRWPRLLVRRQPSG